MTLWNLTDQATGDTLTEVPLHDILRHLYWVADAADFGQDRDADETQEDVARIIAALVNGDREALTRAADRLDLAIEPA